MDIPQHIVDAAHTITQWAESNNRIEWSIDGCTARAPAEKTLLRYRMARTIGCEAWVERWAGWRRHTATGIEFDSIIDARISNLKP